MPELQSGFLIAQLANLLLIVVGIGLSLVALWQLSGQRLSSLHTFAWAVLIILAPFLGALAFLIIRFRVEKA